jgi:S-adenosylmethionine:tRNA ribosyltransferase-isomerase
MLVYKKKTGEIIHDTFRNLPSYLPPHTLLVLNDTKVFPARLPLQKETGGKAQLLITECGKKDIQGLIDHTMRPGVVLCIPGHPRFSFVVSGKTGSAYTLVPRFPLGKLAGLLERYGTTPLPPYLRKSPLSEKKRRAEYQSVFAKHQGSVAAPTASLHFTPRLLRDLRARGIRDARVTLHVGLGTFAPVSDEALRIGRLHEEAYQVSPEAATLIRSAKRLRHPIIPVGTTALRTIESAWDKRFVIRARRASTDLFIRDGYRFRIADGLITNFHVPRSSLMMLVGAMIGRDELMRIYTEAIRERYRFFSFGDGMCIL